MAFLTKQASVTVNASAAATAWINAFHATGQDAERWALYRTMGIEIYATGVQFIATSGSILFRTWVPGTDATGRAHDWPLEEEAPESAVVVMDGNHFALAFVKALLSASKQFEVAELSLTIEPAPAQDESEEPPLGASFSQDVLTLRAFGQQLHCRLFEDKYVNWRALDFGIDTAERVDGMAVSTSMLATIGKLKGVGAVDLTFTGDGKQITMYGVAGSFKGVLMPMRRKEKEKPEIEPEDDAQVDSFKDMDATVSVNGGPKMPATRANMRKAAEQVVTAITRNGRDRAAGRDE
jgi:hypothetical protein